MSDHGPFLVVLVGADETHRYVRDYRTMEEAESSCADRNKRAEEMGITARYAVLEESK